MYHIICCPNFRALTIIFFTCKKKSKETRNVLPYGIFNIVNLNIVNIYVILWGDSAIRISENKHLLSLVYRYNIEDTTRFSWCLNTIEHLYINVIWSVNLTCCVYINICIVFIYIFLLGKGGLGFWTCAQFQL